MRNSASVFAEAIASLKPENYNDPLSIELHDHAAVVQGAAAVKVRIASLQAERDAIPLTRAGKIHEADMWYAESLERRIDELLGEIRQSEGSKES